MRNQGREVGTPETRPTDTTVDSCTPHKRTHIHTWDQDPRVGNSSERRGRNDPGLPSTTDVITVTRTPDLGSSLMGRQGATSDLVGDNY